MTVRSDVIIDWFSSPRIITVLAPSTEITIQDLLDTCREFEDNIENTVYDALASAAGKENLGGGVKVGITLTLENAVLAFEARTGPSYTQCRVNGGNIVAVDNNGLDISPIYPTAFTQILTTASSSATIQEQEDIQFSSFNGSIHINVLSSYSGTAYPVGTPRQPVNNLTDALNIANSRGFSAFYVMSNIVIDNGLDYSNKSFTGASIKRISITIDSNANVDGCEFYNATITGIVDGDLKISDCIINNITYVDGIIERCGLSGVIQLSGLREAVFTNCWDNVAGLGMPTIDCGSGTALIINNYSGGMKLINKTGPEDVTIDLDSGRVVLENTVVDGNFTIRGVGTITNNSTVNVDFSGLLNPSNITNYIWNEPLDQHMLAGSMGKAVANAGLTPEQAKQLLLVFINSL